MNYKSICIYCGSSVGNLPMYQEAASAVGQAIAQRGLTLVYGGGKAGLMGVVADGALGAGGHVIGIIPEALKNRETDHKNLTELHVVETMHERKAMMAGRADAFLTLPGGLGTYEELFEVITWAQLGIHQKPIILLNVADYFAPFQALIEHTRQAGFIRHTDPQLVRLANSVDEIFTLLDDFQPDTRRSKWMSLDET